MNIIDQTSNKFNINFSDDDFESVNLENYTNTSENGIVNNYLDVILVNIKFVRELMAIIDKLEYYVTNNVEAIIDILTKHEFLKFNLRNMISLDCFFQYKNVCLLKWKDYTTKKCSVDAIPDCTHRMDIIKIVPLIALKIVMNEGKYQHDKEDLEPLLELTK